MSRDERWESEYAGLAFQFYHWCLFTLVPSVFSITSPSPLRQPRVAFVNYKQESCCLPCGCAELSFYPLRAWLSPPVLCSLHQSWDCSPGGGQPAGELLVLFCGLQPLRGGSPACMSPVAPMPQDGMVHWPELPWNQEAQKAVLLQVTSWIHLLGGPLIEPTARWITLAAKPFMFWEGEGQHNFLANFPMSTVGLRRERTPQGNGSWILGKILK